MNAFARAVDRFCYKHPRFGIRRLMLGIIIVSAFVYILMVTQAGISLLVFAPNLIVRGQIWRLLTWIFLPLRGTNPMDFLFTAIAFWFYYYMGSTLEREWGAGKFTIYYITGILLHVIYGFIAYYLFSTAVLLTPFYLNLSMLFSFALMYPDMTIRLMLIIPIKIKWLAWFDAAYFLVASISYIFQGAYVYAFFPLIAILNFLLICSEELLTAIRPLRARASPNVMNFKKEAKRVKREMENAPYRHKCAVCGKTDISDPLEEFRYCSKCNGYHCYCSEHINNHIHII